MENASLGQCVSRLGAARIPLLRETVTELERMMGSEDEVLGRDLATVILRDPLLTVQLIRTLQTRRPTRRITDITTIEHALMMLGISNFFAHCRELFQHAPVVENLLGQRPEALHGFFKVAVRARYAAVHARRWALLRADIASDEVVVATMLHDLAELLLWVSDPDAALEIARRMKSDPTLRSAGVQREVLGFSLSELQMALCREWQLPELLLFLMDERHAHQARARNVLLAVALARHSAHGWSDRALADDIAGVRDMLGLPQGEVLSLIYRTELAMLDQGSGCDGAAHWIPPPPQLMAGGSGIDGPEGAHPLLAEHVLAALAESPRRLQGAGAALARFPDASPNLPRFDVMAFSMHGIRIALGMRRVVWLVVDPDCEAIRARFVAGDSEADALRAMRFAIPPADQLNAIFNAVRVAGDNAERWRNIESLIRGIIGTGGRVGASLMLPLHGSADDWSLVYADRPVSAIDEYKVGTFRDIVAATEARLLALDKLG